LESEEKGKGKGRAREERKASEAKRGEKGRKKWRLGERGRREEKQERESKKHTGHERPLNESWEDLLRSIYMTTHPPFFLITLGAGLRTALMASSLRERNEKGKTTRQSIGISKMEREGRGRTRQSSILSASEQSTRGT